MAKKKNFDNDALHEPSFANDGELRKFLALSLAFVRARRHLSQNELASLAGIPNPQSISKYEGGRDIPSPPIIVRLAHALGENPKLWLLYAQLQRAAAKEAEPSKAEATQHILSLMGVVSEQSQGQIDAASSTRRSLTQFPTSFSPLCVIVGDRREERPRHLGDLFAFSASPVDDRWLASLRLPSVTEKITDKVFLFQEPEAKEWRRATFGKTNLLIIGSPAANLAARELNRHFIHRFAVPSEAEKLWSTVKEEKFPTLKTPAELEHFEEANRQYVRRLMRKFQQPGFITYDAEATRDENVIRVVASVITEPQQDFATVTVGRNPFAQKGERFFAILAAGVHHPGTAWAIKFLSQPSRFERHPYGGILEVRFPSRRHDPDKIKWYQSVGLGEADWHTIGKSDLAYDHDSLCNAIRRCLAAKIITDAPVDSAEMEEHLDLLGLLAEKTIGESENTECQE
jgi:transcriptional regulator with XRE-family HTH domain